MQPTPHDPLIGQTIGNYIVRYKLGEGGMGSVYLAEHPTIGKRVAMKVLHAELASRQELVNRFFTEAKAVNDIQHPNIVDIVDYGAMRGPHGETLVYFIMEYLNGVSLAEVVKRDGPLTPERTHTIALQIADALAASHKKGIVHRDLKPDNVILITRGRDRDFVKLLDFGIAKLTSAGGGSSHKTRTGLVMGTPHYMSPEQCEGKASVGHSTDIYALGIVMYEMLTKQVPFPGEGYGEVLVQHMTMPPMALTSLSAAIPPHVDLVVRKALEKRPEQRYPTMDEMMLALADPYAYVEGHGGVAGFLQMTLVASNQQLGAIRTPLPVAMLTPVPGQLVAANKPTTLQGAAAEMQQTAIGVPAPAPRARSNKGLVIGIAAAGTAIAAAVAFLVLNSGGGGGGGGTKEEPQAAASTTEADDDPAEPTPTPAPEPAKTEPTPAPTPAPTPEPAKTEPTPTPTPAPAPPPEPAKTEPTPVPTQPQTIHVTIESDPAGATVEIDGKKKGVTPYSGDLDRSGRSVEVELSLSGYKDTTETIKTDSDVTLDLVLEKKKKASSHKPKTTKETKTDSGVERDNTKNPFDRMKKGTK